MTPTIVHGPASHFLTPEVAAQVASEITQAAGVEVFFIGRRDRESGLVIEIESHAFGSRDAVPALSAFAKPGDVIIHNHPSGLLEPSEPDLNIAASLGQLGVGSLIVNNECTLVRLVVKAHDPGVRRSVERAEVDAALTGTSNLARILGRDFEDRPQQRQMAGAVTDVFNADGIAVIEAGTGTGKSFAYLLPALLFALRNQERVVISTNTINLQEQLLHKDLPALKQVLGVEFQAEILKGRSNYVCRRKAAGIHTEDTALSLLVDDDYKAELAGLLAWIETTATGDRGELPVPPRPETWERVQSESDNCLRVRCPFYETCFFYNSRRRAARATLLIANHSLLLSDLAVRRESGNWSTAAVFPPYRRVVLDEAHHLEEIATEHFGAEISRSGLRRMMSLMARDDHRGGGTRGAIPTIFSVVGQLVRNKVIETEAHAAIPEGANLLAEVLDTRDALEQGMEEFGQAFLFLAGLAMPRDREEHKVRLTPQLLENPAWEGECLPILARLAQALRSCVGSCRRTLKAIERLLEEPPPELRDPCMEWRSLIDRADLRRAVLEGFLEPAPDSVCRWVLVRRDFRRHLVVALCQAPVSVREILSETLHTRMHTEVLTSATLSVDRQFDFFQDRAGLNVEPPPQEDSMGPVPVQKRPVSTLMLDSPFDYRRQVFFGVPTDLGDPREETFEDGLQRLIEESVQVTGGRAFVLFTSHGQMRRLHDRCAPTIRKMGFECLRQGEENRDRLLQRFREDETSVLFATSSFWEGVDVKGRALELLIIAKLPFAVPTEPIQAAQFEALEREGRDPFRELVLPRAIIKFKQGFGRLIRSRTDMGAVLIADDRVLRKSYGQRFLRSLPPIRIQDGPTDSLLKTMELFFAGRRGRAPGQAGTFQG